MYKILLVEDNHQIRESVSDYIEEKTEGEMKVECARTGTEGLRMASESEYDLVLLDIMLPGLNGFEICRSIRKKSIVPILFLTALGREEDVLYGYSLGCDDYIVKPFSLAQLLAKIRALLSRAKGSLNRALRAENIVIDLAEMSVAVDGQMVNLPPKEYEILKLLMENQGRVYSRDELIEKLWGFDTDVTDRVIDNHMKKLRKQLGKSGDCIKTLYKKGYKFKK